MPGMSNIGYEKKKKPGSSSPTKPDPRKPERGRHPRKPFSTNPTKPDPRAPERGRMPHPDLKHKNKSKDKPKTTLSPRKGSMPGPKKKRRLALAPAVKWSKGVVRNQGKVVRHKKMTRAEQLKAGRGNR